MLLDTGRPEIAHLLTAMLQAREAVGRRSWSPPQEPTGEDWWADVLADPRARKRNWRTDEAIRQDSYRLSDELRPVILVACSKCDWRVAFSRDELITAASITWSRSVGCSRRSANRTEQPPRSRCGRKCGLFA